MRSFNYISGATMLMLVVLAAPLPCFSQTTTEGQLPSLPAAVPDAQLPATTINAIPPVTVSPTNAEPATPENVPYIAMPAVPKGSRFSFGDSDVSILFLPSQTQVMKQALTNYESRPVRAAPTEKALEPTLTLDVVAAPNITEPEKYPVFYLSSIVYHGPGDWSLWLSGHKITSVKNLTDVTVTSVSADRASFVWKPAYAEALTLRMQNKTFAATDKVKNRLAANQSSSYSENNGQVSFTLKTNQTFAVGYFNTFEGYIESPKLEAALPVSAASSAPAASSVPAAVPNLPNGLDDVLKQKTVYDVIKAKGE